MIAEDFGPVYTRGQKTREGAASAVRHRHDHRHRGQTSETQELLDADKRPGEKCGLALLGGVLGAAVSYVGFNGYTASTLSNVSFSQIAFDFAVTPELLRDGLIWALVLGAIGGLLPAMRAARMPITAALRGE